MKILQLNMAQPCDIDLYVMKSVSALFHGPVTLPYILKTI